MSEVIYLACPRCGKPSVFAATNPHRPFCSRQCQLIDFGAWANEEHKLAGDSEYPDQSTHSTKET
ncbi:hypothetical protein SAMN05421831_101313 [Allopseudospirillum japonicum]|uniref:DNA gyrase inhibitor YacG n=1 Tax=Allopseudospirillum japonicum TaxID=64971 RepID=A0A1H6QHH7_9GAMM|nr:DNA gyrase inhibitor YacG [Allopseudospirillum japonicum]SEI40414.1 hypothetical protein SAMN05421831_101313 [Allopseudospirillum japonicum]